MNIRRILLFGSILHFILIYLGFFRYLIDEMILSIICFAVVIFTGTILSFFYDSMYKRGLL